ncbi:DNA phosphorothioation system sulfurtransferase DndC [uncultured Intestinimonas sp.]|uniref:DNA phosphorothioation system sulfurtransferase DndC n=1 Tax=uncultured Intestinimonas sp. TaxID=1689265 RepID=UPI002942C656|nr:DNA phosphorothioation system sulfurtransferase DndC [uncultured Intestinimonas sp.]
MFEEYHEIKKEMELVYLHDQRPWMIGYSGGKDSTLLCQLVFEMLESLPEEKRSKPVYIVTSDTMVENPIVKAYMHRMNRAINEASNRKKLNIQAHMIYPETRQTFWSLVIGLGYPTPEPPGFRWCTERLKINPSNAFTYNTIKRDGEIVILLGVRKAESAARSRSISSREIEGKLLTPHPHIQKAYVYSPLAEIPNENVWAYLLKDNGKSAWNTDNNYLYSLYQGENLSEEDSVVGQVNKDNMKVTGNSRFGCWICTMVKEDKSLKNFIDHGATELIPLRDFRNWLVDLRSNPDARDYRRRNGNVYLMSNGEFGRGPFTMEARKEILRRLLQLEVDTGFDLITIDELKVIDKMWEDEGDLSRRALVEIYEKIKGKKLPWDIYKKAKYDSETLALIEDLFQ